MSQPAPPVDSPANSPDGAVRTRARGHVFLIELARPAKRNAFSVEMLRNLSEAYTRFEENDEFRCAVLHAEGPHFTAGLDLAEVGPAVLRGDALFPEAGVDPLDLFAPRRTKPVVGAFQGYCFTIGIELALACDIRLASSDVHFAQIEVNRGIMPFGGATLRLPQLTGWGNAMRYLLTGDAFGAEEALRIGLVQEVVAPEELLERAVALAERVAARAPLAVRASRQSAQTAVEQGPGAAFAELMTHARALMTTEDAKEGMMSFIERRDAKFEGR